MGYTAPMYVNVVTVVCVTLRLEAAFAKLDGVETIARKVCYEYHVTREHQLN
jgi:hypothetical protein